MSKNEETLTNIVERIVSTYVILIVKNVSFAKELMSLICKYLSNDNFNDYTINKHKIEYKYKLKDVSFQEFCKQMKEQFSHANDNHYALCDNNVLAITDVKHTERVTCIRPITPSTFISVGMDSSMIFWKIYSGQYIYSDDERVFYSRLNVRPENIIHNAHKYGINYIDISTKYNRVISCSVDKLLKIWDLKTYKLIKEIKHNTEVTQCLFINADNKIITATSDGHIYVYKFNCDNDDILLSKSIQVCKVSVPLIYKELSAVEDKIHDDKFVCITKHRILYYRNDEIVTSADIYNDIMSGTLSPDGSLFSYVEINYGLTNDEYIVRIVDVDNGMRLLCNIYGNYKPIYDITYCTVEYWVSFISGNQVLIYDLEHKKRIFDDKMKLYDNMETCGNKKILFNGIMVHKNINTNGNITSISWNNPSKMDPILIAGYNDGSIIIYSKPQTN